MSVFAELTPPYSTIVADPPRLGLVGLRLRGRHMTPETGHGMTASRSPKASETWCSLGPEPKRARSLRKQRFPGPKDSPPIGTSDRSNPL